MHVGCRAQHCRAGRVRAHRTGAAAALRTRVGSAPPARSIPASAAPVLPGREYATQGGRAGPRIRHSGRTGPSNSLQDRARRCWASRPFPHLPTLTPPHTWSTSSARMSTYDMAGAALLQFCAGGQGHKVCGTTCPRLRRSGVGGRGAPNTKNFTCIPRHGEREGEAEQARRWRRRRGGADHGCALQ